MTDQDMKRFAAIMMALYKGFNRDPDPIINDLFFMGLKHLVIEDAEQVAQFCLLNEDKFPTIHNLRKYVMMIPPKPVVRLEHKPGPNSGKLAADSQRLIDGYMAGKLTRQNLIEGMEVMERQYPGIGWKTEAAALIRDWRRYDNTPDSKSLAGTSE